MKEFQELVKGFEWSNWGTVGSGQKESKSAEIIGKGFWDIWRESKEEIKSAGYRVYKKNDKWMVAEYKDVVPVVEKIEINVDDIEIKCKDKLYEWQVEHTKHLIYSIRENGSGLDGSSTGTGKSYAAIATAKELNLIPFIVCPKSVIPVWKNVLKHFNMESVGIINYEMLRTGKTEWMKIVTGVDGKKNYKFILPDNTLVITDECHKLKSSKTLNAQIFVAAKEQGYKILGLSATVADNPMHMQALGYILNLFTESKYFWAWSSRFGCSRGQWGWEFDGTMESLIDLHKEIYYKGKGHRIRIKDLGDKFPETLIISDAYDMNSNSKKIQKVYDEMWLELDSLKNKEMEDKQACILTLQLRARQKVELLKVPTLVEMTQDHIEEGNSVVVFVNFTESLNKIAEKLKTDCVIHGKQTAEEREQNINRFQNDESRVIVANSAAGGLGISLHDINGKYPRVSLLSPSYSAVSMKQCLGRVHRAGGKSKSIQKLIFAANTIEENVCNTLRKKIDRINLINDGDLSDLNFR